MTETVDDAFIRSLRIATGGRFTGCMIRILECLGGSYLVTTDIFGDRTYRPDVIDWYLALDMRFPDEMEILGAMAL